MNQVPPTSSTLSKHWITCPLEMMDEDKLLEEAIEAELSKIQISSSEIEESKEEELEEDILNESEPDADDLPTSVICYLEQIKQRSEAVEKLILQNLEQPEYVDNPVQKNCPGSEILMELASEFGEDQLKLKEKILAQIEEGEQRNDAESQKSIKSNFQIETTDQPLEDERISDDENIITSKCKEVEEHCWLTLQQWELEEEKRQKIKLIELKEQREKEKKQVEKEEERAKSRQQQFEEEVEKLTEERRQEQATLEEKIRQDQEALEKELKHHEALIQSMQLKLDEERQIFEKQQEKERKRVEELYCRAATTIQARFRTYLILKEYASVLKEKRDERMRTKDLHLKMAQERKEFEEKIKRKLAAQNRVEKEERRKREESVRLQREEQKQRQIEYEKKKEQERQRLEKERRVKLENLQKLEEEEKQRQLAKNKKKGQKEAEESKFLELKKNTGRLELTEGKSEKEVVLQMIEEVDADFSIKNCNSMDSMLISLNEHVCLPNNIPGNSPLNSSRIEDQCIIGRDTGENVKKRIPAEETVEGKAENTPAIESNVTTPTSNIMKVIIPCEVADAFPGKPSGGDQSVLTTNSNKIQDDAWIDPCKVIENMDITLENTFTRGLVLDNVEQKRLNWMKVCTPWSKISRENERKNVKPEIRLRNNSISRLPALNPEAILHSSVWTSLQQVTTVTLQDLPGCSLSTLSQCPRLKSLILRNCGIETLDGVNNCKGLKYIDVQENNIKNIHSLEIEDLYVLLLSHNKISSMHGLGKCSNLCILELSHNNITRIGGLESLKKLQRLVIDHNQLISTKDLRETPTLIYLDCSFNHLSSIEGIDNCGLLQTLKLQNNNLSELPRFGNHVLLRDVCLDNNSISSLKELADYWLPMLQSLSLSQNSLTRLTAMSEFQMLERFNISDNRLSGCHSLLKLTLDENPFQQESGWRCSILKALPNLEMLNGERISSTDEASAERLREPSTGSFLAVCQAQLQHIELLHKRHKTELDTLNSLEIADLHCYHCEELMQLAEECRYAHEYGELCSSEGNKHPNCDKEEFHGGKQQKMLTINCANVNGQKTDHKVDSVQVQTPVTHKSNKQSNLSHTACQDSKDCNPRLLSVLERTAISLQDFRIKKGQIHSESNRMASESQNKECESHQQQISEDNMKSYAATVLQSHWRGYRIRRDILKFVILHNAASVIQSAWRDYCGRKKASFWNSARKTPQKWKLFDDREESRNQAVVIIQAHWRGYHLRKKLSHALAAVHIEEDDVFEEVNLNEFVFDEATLDKDWIKLDPQISSQTIPIKNTDLQSEILTRYTPDSFGLPRQPQLAWQGDDINTAKKYEQACSSPLQQYSPRETLSAPSEATFMSEKEEQISLEWGFKDLHTAHLMLKRAQKMKSKKTEAKKLQDPIARLALFKNKKIKYFPTKSSKKIHDCTKHFNVPEEPSHQDATSLETLQATYQWLHTQVTNREERHFRKKQHHRFLPEMNPEVLNGGHVQLMARPLGKESSGLDLVSVSRVSQQSSKFQANRWHSSGSSKTTVPPKTGSKPFKQERLSFRDHPMRLSTGWGTGKRKGKSF
ncbi:leucine-rich repeat and IQ domain-containing protein 1 isoform X2 [Narcine bancroftii]|uniref:leucine-rich repeat and IQ domain-containing protein 1 isoform X2 n=1 Tax=Narcine bancroftii TaxID=1343680 RepID=UPI0038314D24